jgi:uncharacterized protein YecT (DUF1311 family)
MRYFGRTVGLALVLGLAGHAGLASAAPASSACDSPDNNFDRLYCENKVFMQADNDLNAAYGKLRKQLNASDQSTLKTRQVAWIRERNETCSRSEGQGIMVNLNCANRMTIERTNWLTDRERECTSSGCRSGRIAE